MNGRQVPNVASTPAENLENMDLGNGWTVASRITRKKRSTGGTSPSDTKSWVRRVKKLL